MCFQSTLALQSLELYLKHTTNEALTYGGGHTLVECVTEFALLFVVIVAIEGKCQQRVYVDQNQAIHENPDQRATCIVSICMQ